MNKCFLIISFMKLIYIYKLEIIINTGNNEMYQACLIVIQPSVIINFETENLIRIVVVVHNVYSINCIMYDGIDAY